MRLITAHRILIAAGIAFFLFYAAVQVVRGFLRTGDPLAIVQGVVSVAIALGLGLYYRTLSRWNGPS